MSFHVGQHVVCVDARVGPGEPPPYLTLNTVYTVSWIGFEGDCPLVDVYELPHPEDQNWYRGYDARRFRPLDESRLDIFRAHLAPSPKQKERA